jgi:hypothetical protein
MGIKCWNLGFNAHGLKKIIDAVQQTLAMNNIYQ